ncbi:MAG TPA: type II toxin-antitoxin system VapC family toxin [Longimicrobiales bacterium]
MILVDTSVWIDHLARGDVRVVDALEAGTVWSHAFVIGELACGNLRNRAEVLHLLGRLPRVPEATDDETMAFVERRRLMGKGIGWVDAHLLAAALLAGVRVWTRDRRLAQVAGDLDLLHS